MKIQEVAVGVIANAHRQIFITRRQASSHLAGYWEFPGGKIETGETVEQGLYRELLEEIGIRIVSPQLLKCVDYCYSDKQLRLHFYLIQQWQGEPYGKEGQSGQWVAIDSLGKFRFPEINQQIVELLQAYSLEQIAVNACSD